MNVIKMRPHHALCIQKYVGKGYNDEFINNMNYIVNRLKTENPSIMLIKECDSICSCCPNRKVNICKQEEKVSEYDKKVLELINADFNNIIAWDELEEKVKNNILLKYNHREVCRGCSWIDICSSIDINCDFVR